MRMVFGLVLIAGLGLAGFAVYMAQSYIAQYEQALARERQQRPEQIPLTTVFVAKETLTYGQELKPEQVRQVRFPTDALPEGAFTDAAVLFPENAEGTRLVLRQMEVNEPILAVKITEPGGSAGVASRLAPGTRAFAIKVDATSGVSGFLSPGDRVDVYWTAGTGNGEGVTRMIEANMRIIGIDQESREERIGPTVARTVTVEARPLQVAALAQAQASGSLSLALVGIGDDSVSESVEIDSATLLGNVQEAPQELVAVEEKQCTIRTRRGSEVVEMAIPCTNRHPPARRPCHRRRVRPLQFVHIKDASQTADSCKKSRNRPCWRKIGA